MNGTMTIWIIIVSLLILIFIFRAINNFRKECSRDKKKPHIIEISTSDEIFFCPGDKKNRNGDIED